MESIDLIFKKRIDWKKNGNSNIYLYSLVGDERVELTINDFPDEPMYTLKIGDNTISFDDSPKNWTLPPLTE